MKTGTSRWPPIIIGAAVVVAMVLRLSIGLHTLRDVELDDEVIYLASGLELAPGHWPQATSSPLYSAWYWLLGHVQPDPLRLYFLNWALITLLLGFGCFLVLRQLTKRPIWPIVVTFAFLNSNLMATWPFVTLLAAAFLLLASGIALRAPTVRRAVLVLAWALGIVTFIRPEFATTFFVFVAASLVLFWRLEGLRLPQLRILVAALLPFIALTLLLGWPLGGQRSIGAFAQHYALNLWKHNLIVGNPWTNSTAFFQAFGHAQSITEAFRANPHEFFRHVMWNVEWLPITAGYLLIPALRLNRIIVMAWLLVVLIVLGIAVVNTIRTIWRREWGTVRSGMIPLCVLYAALLATTLLSSLLIHPRPHYLIPLVALTIVMACWQPPRWPWRLPSAWEPWLIVAVGALVVCLTPSPLAGPTTAVVRAPTSLGKLYVTPTALALRALHLRGRFTIVESHFGYAVCAGYRDAVHKSADELGDLSGVDVVVIDDFLRGSAAGNPAFQELLRAPESAGFETVAVPDTSNVIAVRRALRTSLLGAPHEVVATQFTVNAAGAGY